MIATRHLPSLNPPPYEPGRKLPIGPTDMRDPDGRAFTAAWLDHVEAGRIGAAPAMPEDIRDTILANERLMRGGGSSGGR